MEHYFQAMKFIETDHYQKILNAGKKKLIENSPYDKYWGIGKYGKGKNRLGELLMQLRKELN